jgi:hypothetical protein
LRDGAEVDASRIVKGGSGNGATKSDASDCGANIVEHRDAIAAGAQAHTIAALKSKFKPAGTVLPYQAEMKLA